MTTLDDDIQNALRHHQSGRLDQAEQGYRQVLQVNPRHPDAMHLLGVVAYQCGRHEPAIQLIRSAIAERPGSSVYQNNLGLAYRGAHKFGEARVCHEEALRIDPGYASAHANLGYVLRELGDLNAALESYQEAVRCLPGSAEAHHGKGKVLQEVGRLAEALASHEEALRIQPGLVEARYNRGEVLEDLGRLPEALASYQHASRLRPDHVEAHHSAGELLEDLGRNEEAREWWERPLRDAARDGDKVRAVLATPAIFQSADRMSRQRQRLEASLAKLEVMSLFIDDPLTEVNTTNFYAAYHGLDEKSPQARIASIHARACPSLLYVAPHCRESHEAGPSGPLRVGFLSSFLHMHTIGEVTIGLIRNLSRKVCRVVLLQPPGPDDNIARLIREDADEVVTLTPSLDAARRQIAERRLDVLFYTDIGMDPFTYFLAFARLAPVQCVTWGHPVTTGIPTLDYYVSCADFEPRGADEHYTERLVRLSSAPTFYYAPAFFPPAKTREYFGLHAGLHYYLCTQAPFKVHPDFDDFLSEILRADPLGRVLFIRSQSPQWTHQLLRRFHRSLSDVIDRIHFLPHQGGQDYLHLLAVCDVLLDTTHFGGGNTNFKAFSVGTPVVTLPGAFARSHVAAACYRKMGVLDCIAYDREEYVQIALRLGVDPTWRETIRARIQANKHLIFEDAEIPRELERFFMEAMERTRTLRETPR